MYIPEPIVHGILSIFLIAMFFHSVTLGMQMGYLHAQDEQNKKSHDQMLVDNIHNEIMKQSGKCLLIIVAEFIGILIIIIAL